MPQEQKKNTLEEMQSSHPFHCYLYGHTLMHKQMFEGFTAKLKDRHVDEVLKKLGYNHCEIFYSPISLTLFYMLIVVLGSVLPLLQIISFRSGWSFVIIIALTIYFCACCIVAAYSNNSFALTDAELVVINPNSPFRKHTIIPLNAIMNVHIGISKSLWRKSFFFLTGNYADIQTQNGITRYYCIGLEDDDFDGNRTEKTIEEFVMALRQRNMQAKMGDEFGY